MFKTKQFYAIMATMTMVASCSSPEASRRPTHPPAPVAAVPADETGFSLLAPPAPCGCEAFGSGTLFDASTSQTVSFTIQISGKRASENPETPFAKGTAIFDHPTLGRLRFKFNRIECAGLQVGDSVAGLTFRGDNLVYSITVNEETQSVQVFDVSAGTPILGGTVTSGSVTVNPLPDCQ